MPRSKNNGHAPARKMPIKRSDPVVLEGDYEGWEFIYRKNPPMGRFADTLELMMSDNEDDSNSPTGMRAMIDVLEMLVLDWNFVDVDGKELPLSRAGLNELPDELIATMFSAVNRGVQSAPLATESS